MNKTFVVFNLYIFLQHALLDCFLSYR